MNARAPFEFHWKLGAACWSGSLAPMYSAHGHTELEANFLPSGRALYDFGEQRVAVESGRLAIFSGLRPHRLTKIEGRAFCFWFTVPLATFLEWDLPSDFVTAFLGGSVLLDHAGDPDEDLARFRRWEGDWRSGGRGRRRAALLEFRARLERMAACRLPTPGSSNAIASESPRGPQGQQVLEQLVAYVSAHFRDPITVSSVAAAVQVHPHYATHLMQRQMGVSLKEFIIRLRLDHACHLLAGTDRSILDVAQDSGFSTMSRFYEAFGARFGEAPGEWRQRAALSGRFGAIDERET